MEPNFGYLLAGYLAILVVIFAYIFRLFRAQRKVQRELESIKDSLQKKS